MLFTHFFILVIIILIVQIVCCVGNRTILEVGHEMITTPTVFVLGAGASKPYGLPLGGELVGKITSLGKKWAKGLGLDGDHYDSFKSELLMSHQPSIDAFLEHRPEFIEIGKLAIADVLLRSENSGYLIEKSEERWYTAFANDKLCGGAFEEFAKNKVAVVTFNYDRSLEQFLFVVLKSRYGKSEPEVAEMLKKIEIIHVHGSLGRLPWQGGSGKPIRYGDPTTEEEVRESAACINIVTDAELNDCDEFKKARKVLAASDNVFLLGFGYHRANVERLELSKKREHTCVGTSFGFTYPEVRHLGSQHKWLNAEHGKMRPIHEFVRNSSYVGL